MLDTQMPRNSQRDADESVKTVEQELIDNLNAKLENANKLIEYLNCRIEGYEETEK